MKSFALTFSYALFWLAFSLFFVFVSLPSVSPYSVLKLKTLRVHAPEPYSVLKHKTLRVHGPEPLQFGPAVIVTRRDERGTKR